MGTAGREGTQLAFGRSDLKNGANDAAIGGEDEKEAAEGQETHTDETHHLHYVTIYISFLLPSIYFFFNLQCQCS